LVNFSHIQNSAEVNTYIQKADDTMRAIGYTEHCFPHVTKTALQAAKILEELDYSPHTIEIAKIAGYMHDIGNAINRCDHAHTGALMAFQLLLKTDMSPDDISTIICAIGNHDEATGAPINEVAAALILADKSDVRRSRVRDEQNLRSDIHDRVNYAVVESSLSLNKGDMSITLRLSIDTEQCAVMDYFEIFLTRMLLCRRAAEYLHLHFKLVINEVELL
jgi:metal-dependent HD superfamily phosphatase/phosphodiesterase